MCLWITRAGWIARCDYGIPNCILRSLLRLLTSTTLSSAPSTGGRRPRSRRALHDVRYHASPASESDLSRSSRTPGGTGNPRGRPLRDPVPFILPGSSQDKPSTSTGSCLSVSLILFFGRPSNFSPYTTTLEETYAVELLTCVPFGLSGRPGLSRGTEHIWRCMFFERLSIRR